MSSQTNQIEIAQGNVPINSDNNFFGGLLTGTIPLIVVGTIIFIWFIRSFMCICKPNEIVILSGLKRKNKQGEEKGYRVITGGRAIVIPIVETVKRMDITTMPVRIEVRNAYSKGGIPLNIQAIANVKICSNPKVVGNAIERFLGQNQSEILRVAKETLEGYLRGIVANLTPEDLNQDRLSFAAKVATDVGRDLLKLGLQIDTLKVQNISDDVDYLKSIGRKQIAVVIRNAEIAESNAINQAERIEAQCQQEAEVAKTNNRITILEKENELRKIKAELEQQTSSQEQITIAITEETAAKAQQKLQTLRSEVERLRLEVEKVLPAEANRQARELHAEGAAAGLAENAKATALVNDMLSEVWQEIGSEATDLLLIQQLEVILKKASTIPGKLKLENVKVIDHGDGKSVSSLLKVYPEILTGFLSSVKDTLGIDVIGTLNKQESQEGEE